MLADSKSCKNLARFCFPKNHGFSSMTITEEHDYKEVVHMTFQKLNNLEVISCKLFENSLRRLNDQKKYDPK